MGLISNNESFATGASGTLVTSKLNVFRRMMDSIMLGAWEITLDLQPGKSDCPNGTCRYNPTYDRYQGANGALCRTCAGRGFLIEPRRTVYKCNRRWTNQPLDQAENTGEATIGGRISGNFVRVKTVAAAYQHIREAIGATIDGKKVKLYKEPSYTGWGGTNLYTISWWEVMDK